MSDITLRNIAVSLRDIADQVEAGAFGKLQKRRLTKPDALADQHAASITEYLRGRREVSGDDIARAIWGRSADRSLAVRIGHYMKRVGGWYKVRTGGGWRYRRAVAPAPEEALP